MGFLANLFGREDAATRDARRIYAAVMAQSRNPGFYGDDRMPDTYDGRIEVLTLHIAALLSALNGQGVNGERLGQALFDEMKDDFEIALREEGLSDAGVKKRITPMISLFYDRVRRYAEVLHTDGTTAELGDAFSESLGPDSKAFSDAMATYLSAFDAKLAPLNLGQLALADFEFPAAPA